MCIWIVFLTVAGSSDPVLHLHDKWGLRDTVYTWTDFTTSVWYTEASGIQCTHNVFLCHILSDSAWIISTNEAWRTAH